MPKQKIQKTAAAKMRPDAGVVELAQVGSEKLFRTVESSSKIEMM